MVVVSRFRSQIKNKVIIEIASMIPATWDKDVDHLKNLNLFFTRLNGLHKSLYFFV